MILKCFDFALCTPLLAWARCTPVLHAAVDAREVPRWPLKAVLLNTQPPLLLGGVLLAPVEAVPQHSCDNLVELGRK